MLLFAGCAKPVDPANPDISATDNALEAADGNSTSATSAGQSSRLIPPKKPADTATVSNELIVADTVVNQEPGVGLDSSRDPGNGQYISQETDSSQTVELNNLTTPRAAGIPMLAAAAPQDNKAESLADKLEQLTILAISGDSDAQLELGDAYASGLTAEAGIDGADIDNAATETIDSEAEAHRWYQLAAEQGNHVAQYKLGLQYFSGVGTAKDYAMAREWWLESATLGSADAQQKLGYLYSEAIGVERDYNRAIDWYTRAANLGHAEAQTLLGSLYHEGNRVPQNYREAFKWYKLAAERGHPHAQYTLATLYHDGLGTEQNFVRCIAWVDVALANGYTDEFNARDECSKYLDDSDLEEAVALAKRWKSSYVNRRGFN